jgi:hypothetical protein
MKKLMIAALACSVASGVFAAGFQLSLVPDIAIQDRETEIKGVSIGVWNENPGAQWAIGFVNGATGESKGLQGPILYTIYNYADTFSGMQWGLVNYANTMTGVQWGAVNIANTFKGFQWGLVNYTKDLTGLQLAAVNYAQKSTSGVQVGLVNIIPENQWFSDGDLGPFFVFVNWGF